MSHSTDFIDDDLTARRVGPDGMIDPIAARRAQQSNLERMSQQRERLEDKVATTAQELERLRQKQEDLEDQKKTLEEVRRQQAHYLKEKKEMGQRIHQSLVLLEKEEVRVAQLTDLYVDSREKLSRMSERIDGMAEGDWDEDRFDEQIAKALDQLKAMRMEFNKALARLDAFGWPPETGETDPELDPTEPGFVHWLLIGLAVGLPIALLGGITAILVYFTLTKWLVI